MKIPESKYYTHLVAYRSVYMFAFPPEISSIKYFIVKKPRFSHALVLKQDGSPLLIGRLLAKYLAS